MDCNSCEIKIELKNCFEALKEANEKISNLKLEQWEMKKKLEKEIRSLSAPQNKPVEESTEGFYSDILQASDKIKSEVASNKQQLIAHMQEKYSGKRILFVIPLGMTNGGGNVIMNEAVAMRKFGVDAEIMNLESQSETFLENYGDMDIPVIFVEDFEKAKDVCGEFDVVCATSWQTVYAAEMKEVSKFTKTAYYIQDFEPNFYSDKKSLEYVYSLESYTVVPKMTCVTKTEWNARTVENNTGRKCKVLCPSFRADKFKPSGRNTKGKIVISAMVRPQSMIRSPELTMDILAEIYRRFGEAVEIHIFGNEECADTDFFICAETNFEYINHELTSPEETAKILGASDIFADFSKYQAMGLTAMEAMAAGCAVVVPIAGGITGFAHNEENSLVVDTSNREECINAVERLVTNRALRERLANKAIEDVNEFYSERCAAMFLEAVFGDDRIDKDIIPTDRRTSDKGIDFDKIKLIIWDMDDTFWRGTLSEGNVVCPEEHTLLIKLLSMEGIINSISSKNDYQPVIDELEKIEEGLTSYFVFNTINWEEKGAQIAGKLKAMKLRAENTLFIDDNCRNREEVMAVNEGIMAAEPTIITELIKYVADRIKTEGGVKDAQKTRLEQYHLLEKRTESLENYSSSDEFLYDSVIRIEFGFDCLEKIDRITDLVERANQLNYTKVRSSKAELKKMINSDWNRSAYISVSDKFGDYGIVGFYCYNKLEKKMEHFLFSCRILGMGVEQYVYNRMGCPDFEVALPVASQLEKDKSIDWIKEDTEITAVKKSDKKNGNLKRILLKGPCDLSAIEQYLIGGSITSEFNFVNNKGYVTTGQNHSVHIFEGSVLTEEEIDQILADAPFLIREDFETLLFKNEYNVVCYSLLPDCHAGLYQHKETGLYASFGSVNFDLTDEKNREGYIDGSIPNHFYPFTEEILKHFADKWEYVGTTPDDVLLYNLEYMYDNIPGRPIIVLLLGSETEYEGVNEEFADHADRHKHVNALVREFAADKSRIRLINLTDFVKSQSDYEDSINHFSRRVYYDVATEVVKCINEINLK